MKPSFHLVATLAFAALSLAGPTPQQTAAPLQFTDGEILGRSEAPVSPLVAARALPPAVCNKIKVLVDLLKIRSATPFCSSFLGIQTTTTTISTSVTGTETATTSIFTTVTETIVASTETLEFETTLVTGTERNTVATQTNSITSITIRPFTTSTVTSTTTYIPAVAKRDLVERALPGWLAGFASKAVSTACQCLDIPTPTATESFTASFTNTETVTERPTITEYSSITTTTSTTETIQVATTTPYTYTTVVTTTITSSTAVLTVTSTTVVVLPTPALCKAPIIMYNGLRPRDFAPLITHDYGSIADPECCMKCFVLPGCIAWVRNSGSQPCLGLTVASNRYPNQPPTSRCPWGVGDTIFGTSGFGAVGKGPCDNLGEWNGESIR